MEKTWLITGCSAGLGRALAESVAGRGDRLLATARSPAALQVAAAVDLQAVDADDPPLHLPLGPAARRTAERKLDAFRADIAAWRGISVATDFVNEDRRAGS